MKIKYYSPITGLHHQTICDKEDFLFFVRHGVFSKTPQQILDLVIKQGRFVQRDDISGYETIYEL